MSRQAALTLLACALSFTACEFRLPNLDDLSPQVQRVVISAEVVTLGVGETILLAAEVIGETGVHQDVEWSSDDVSIATVDHSGTVTGVAPGNVRITARSVANTSFADSIDIEVVRCPMAIEVPSVVQDAHWTSNGDPECVHYRLTSGVRVDGHLTIEPGTRIVAESKSAGLEINGRITASGTEEEPIVFTAATPLSGQWRGIRIGSKEENLLEYVDLGNCGSEKWVFTDGEPACLYVRDGSVRLRNSSIHDSAAYGVYLHHSGDALPGFSGNRFYGTGTPLHIFPTQIHQLDVETDFSADEYNTNSVEAVTVGGGNFENGPFGGAAIWPALRNGYPYRVLRPIGLGTAVAIQAGAVFEFENDTGIEVNGSGSLNASGTESAFIVFRGTADVPGRWRGLKFSSTAFENELNYVEVANGGNEDGWVFTDSARANVYVRAGAVTIRNSVIRDSLAYGIALHGPADALSGFENNRFFDNGRALRIFATQVHSLDGDTDFEADIDRPNATKGVEVRGDTVSGSAAVVRHWPALRDGYPYVFYGATVLESAVDVGAGALLRFAQDAGLEVRSNGRLKAIGTEVEPIVFQGDVDLPGRWKGIKINSMDVENELQWAILENGAGGRHVFTDNGEGLLMLREGRMKVSNTTFGEIPVTATSDAWAILCLGSNAVVDGGGNDFSQVEPGRELHSNCTVQ